MHVADGTPDGQDLTVTVSIGCALREDSSEDTIDRLIARADAATASVAG
jgi:GGDEF domain-containing protein